MKTLLLIFLLATTALAQDLETALRTGLYEEEANQDLPAAIAAYEEAITYFDTQRQAAATAIFRLAECYAKAGEQEKAEALYSRVAQEFGEIDKLGELARNKLGKTSPDLPKENSEEIRIEEIKEVLSKSPDLVNHIREETKLTLLEEAVMAEQPEVVAFLLSEGALPGYRNPLYYAAKLGDPTIASLLLEAGADPNQYGELRESYTHAAPLHIATALGHRQTVLTLLSHGAKLKYVARVSDDIIPAIILDKISDRKDPLRIFNRTPLDLAIILNFENLTKLFIERSNSTEDPERIKTLALVTATEMKSEHFASILLEAGANIDGRSVISPPISVAIERGVGLQFIKFLIDAGASPNVKDANGNSPLHLAAIRGKSDVIRLLAKAGANFNTRNEEGQTPIFLSNRPQEEAIDFYIENGSDLNIQDNDLETPLITAIKGSWPIYAINELLTNGAKPNLQSKSGDTALHYAMSRPKEVVELLLAHGANPDIRNTDGEKPGSGGARSGNLRVIEKFRIYDRIHGQRAKRISVILPENSPSSATVKIVSFQDEPCRNTLFEMVVACRSSALFGHARILRFQEIGQPDKVIEVDVRAAVESKDPAKDIPLEWGDVIELTSDNKGAGITKEAADFLDDYLRRNIKVSFFGAVEVTKDLTFTPTIWKPSSEEGIVLPAAKASDSRDDSTGTWDYKDLRNIVPNMLFPDLSLQEITRRVSGDLTARYTGEGFPFLLDGDELKIGVVQGVRRRVVPRAR